MLNIAEIYRRVKARIVSAPMPPEHPAQGLAERSSTPFISRCTDEELQALAHAWRELLERQGLSPLNMEIGAGLLSIKFPSSQHQYSQLRIGRGWLEFDGSSSDDDNVVKVALQYFHSTYGHVVCFGDEEFQGRVRRLGEEIGVRVTPTPIRRSAPARSGVFPETARSNNLLDRGDPNSPLMRGPR